MQDTRQPVASRRKQLTEGSIRRGIFSLAIPTTAGLLVHSAFEIVDMIWIGRLGGEAIAAVSVSSFIFWLVLSLGEVVETGVLALVARRVGEGDIPRAAYQGWQGIGFSLVASLVVGFAFLLALKGVFRFMQTPPQVTEIGLSYLTIIMLGLPVFFVENAIEAVFMGSGDAKTPMYILIFSLILNAVLDPLLIFGWLGFPEMGVAGAAVATIFSGAVGLVIAFVYLPPFMYGRTAPPLLSRFIPDTEIYNKILKIGLPASASGAFFCFVYMWLTRITTQFGVPAMAALGIGHKLESVTYFTGVGFGEAAATLVGQNYVSAFMGGMFLLFPAFLMRIFTDDPAIIEAGTLYLRIVAIPQVFGAFDMVIESAFIGAGNTIPPMLISVPLFFSKIPLAYTLSSPSFFGSATGIWLAIALTMVLNGILIPLWFRRGHWKEKKV
jgi:putative MATE family efflux protein